MMARVQMIDGEGEEEAETDRSRRGEGTGRRQGAAAAVNARPPSCEGKAQLANERVVQ